MVFDTLKSLVSPASEFFAGIYTNNIRPLAVAAMSAVSGFAASAWASAQSTPALIAKAPAFVAANPVTVALVATAVVAVAGLAYAYSRSEDGSLGFNFELPSFSNLSKAAKDFSAKAGKFLGFDTGLSNKEEVANKNAAAAMQSAPKVRAAVDAQHAAAAKKEADAQASADEAKAGAPAAAVEVVEHEEEEEAAPAAAEAQAEAQAEAEAEAEAERSSRSPSRSPSL